MFFVLFFGSMENLYKPPHLRPSRMEYEALVCTTPSKLGGVNWTLVHLYTCTGVQVQCTGVQQFSFTAQSWEGRAECCMRWLSENRAATHSHREIPAAHSHQSQLEINNILVHTDNPPPYFLQRNSDSKAVGF